MPDSGEDYDAPTADSANDQTVISVAEVRKDTPETTILTAAPSPASRHRSVAVE